MRLRQRTTTLVTTTALTAADRAGTVGLWLFDEQEGFYQSSMLNDVAPDSYCGSSLGRKS